MNSHMKSKDFSVRLMRPAEMQMLQLGSLEWKPSRLKEQFLDCDK